MRLNKTTLQFTVRLLLPVLAVAGALGAAALSLHGMADETNRIEDRLTTRSVEAALRADLRHLADTHTDYAVWDDAVRGLYGTLDQDFIDQNYRVSTAAATFFDTVYLLDENGNVAFAFHDGEPIDLSPTSAFGPALPSLVAAVPRDGRSSGAATGIVATPWGLEAIAVGPVVPNTDAIVQPPARARLLIIGRKLDENAVTTMGQDYVIAGLHIAGREDPAGVVLTDPDGTVVGRLAWTPPLLGSRASANVGPLVYFMFALVAAIVASLSLLAFRARTRNEHLANEALTQGRRLEAALASIPSGICMFDADRRLVFSNALYAAMYKLPPELVEPGTPLDTIVNYRRMIGNAPADFPNYVSHAGIEWETGGKYLFEFALDDGRTIRITHLSMEGGSYVAVHEDVTAAMQAQDQLLRMSHRDAVTDLANRLGFREGLNAALAKADPQSGPAVLFLDLDRFKSVNDTLGPEAGDRLLAVVAARLRSIAGPGDLVGRLGGNSFAIAQAKGEQPDAAGRLAQSIVTAMAEPFDVGGNRLSIGVSIGIALGPEPSANADAILRRAELALRWVKSHHRGTFQFFDGEMEAAVQSRHQIDAGLRHAMEGEELEVHYQPVVDLKTNAVVGFEALLRWRHPMIGYISPAEFIPVAEESGLIVEIGAWVLRRACADAAHWPRHLGVAVNLSPVQFKDPHLPETIFSALAAAQLEPGRLEIEITESVLLADNKAIAAVLQQVHSYGVRIAMDDFGTGYSSLGYLRSFPFDKIKIDQSFVRDIAGNAETLAIVRAIVRLGAEFGVTVVAEGVETAEQMEIVREAGCDQMQGFCFSEARPLAELGDLLTGRSAGRSVAA